MANVKTDQLYMQLNAAELEAIIKKDCPSSNDRDAGFCSASSESEGGDDLALEHARVGSPCIGPTKEYGAVKDKSIVLVRNKRKSMEPSKVVESTLTSSNLCTSSTACLYMAASGPLKKRIRYTSSADSAVMLTPPSPASPPHINININNNNNNNNNNNSNNSNSNSNNNSNNNSNSNNNNNNNNNNSNNINFNNNISNLPTALVHMWDPSQVLSNEIMPNPAHIYLRHPGVTTLHRAYNYSKQPEQQEPLSLVYKKPKIIENEISEQQLHSNCNLSSDKKTAAHKKVAKTTLDIEEQLEEDQHNEDINKDNHSESSLLRPQQRNYKNMTRERRIEANARERTRVHTISAAYETLRHAVPAYASSQKLSKLSVLRVACSYILTLSRMAGQDYSADQSEPSIADCIEAITSTIQTEGKVKRKKEE